MANSALRYSQNSTLLAHEVFRLQKKEKFGTMVNDVLNCELPRLLAHEVFNLQKKEKFGTKVNDVLNCETRTS